jgi:putative Mg2+ transporter-C (MgtC) family protein
MAWLEQAWQCSAWCASDELQMALRLAVAMFAGALIGFERSFHGRPAGLRTHTLVSLASAMLMLVTVYQHKWFHGVAETVRIDPTRMAQGVMTGIGFLGAGVIIKDGASVRGLTTAASIWITSAIGILAGVGFFFPLAVCTAAALGALGLLRWLERWLPTFSYATHSVAFPLNAAMDEQGLRRFLGARGFSVDNVSCHFDQHRGTVEYEMTIRTKLKEGLVRLNDAWSQKQEATSFRITPL